MSNVTSLELSKELYAVSGWQDTSYLWHLINGKAAYAVFAGANGYKGGNKLEDYEMHAYDLGYLMRKLPRTIPFSDGEISLRLEIQWSGGWVAHYGVYDWKSAIADTPENAAAKLCIELFKNGILTREKE